MKPTVALILAALSFAAPAAVPQSASAASGAEINQDADKTLRSFVAQTPEAQDLAKKAVGILVCPSVLKAGFGIGGEYGEGVLIVKRQIAGYYNLVSASFGFQLGVQDRSVIIMFMTENALRSFQSTYGWKVGVDGSIVVLTVGAGGTIDTENLTSPVIAFVLDQTGLMYNLSLEGSKISRINR
jgi:lipid-binding SYLF domain-containing protein